MTSTPRILAAALGLAAACGASAATFQNGSFELNSLGSPTYADVTGAGVTGWTAVTPGFEWFAPATYGGAPGPLGLAADGSYAVDLAFVSSVGGGLSQTFDTTIGTEYAVSFAAGTSNFAGRSGTGLIIATVDSGAPTFFAAVANASAPIAWSTYGFSFVATGTQTKLSFLNDQDGNSHFAFVDAVQVSAVPEPHEWAMMATGLALVGWIARRRRETRGASVARA